MSAKPDQERDTGQNETEPRRREIPAPEPMDAAEFTAIGRALYGENWKSPMARTMGRTYSAVLRNSDGTAPIDRVTAGFLRLLASRYRVKW